MKIIHINKDGEVIKDLSKITLNETLSIELLTLMAENRREETK